MDNTKNGFEWFAGGNAPLLFPTELVMGNFLGDDLTKVDIPESYPFADVWGKTVSMHLSSEKYHPAPKYIVIAWFSIVEDKFYAVAEELPQELIATLLAEKNEKTKEPKYDTLIAGMAPYGKLAIWLSGNGITTEVAWLQGKEIHVEMKDFAPDSKLNREEYAKEALESCKEASENLWKNGLPDPLLFEQYMQKFNYRITPKFENKEFIFNGIELYYYNGEFDTTNAGEHAENAMRAKPSKIVLRWSEGKKQYGAYFWTDEKKLIDTFKSVYGDEVQKEGSLMIEVKSSHKQFQFFLQTDDTSVEIPMEEIPHIIFKNKFEFFKSKNYNRGKGGWKY